MMLTHASLFSGIGGIDLAAEWAGFKSIAQVEIGEYQTKVLEKNFPKAKRWRDVKKFTGESFYKETGIRQPTILSGGFPCQPHSTAGKRLGSDDERDLWGEYRRIISEIKPRWVVAENVRGLLSTEAGRFFRGVLRDLSDLGYDVGWCTYPAAWVGAIHRRERVFTIAHTSGERQFGVGEDKQEQRRKILDEITNSAKTWAGIDDKQNDLLQHGARLIRDGSGVNQRNDDGIPQGLDRLVALGNAVVPYQVYPIFKIIKEIEGKRL